MDRGRFSCCWCAGLTPPKQRNEEHAGGTAALPGGTTLPGSKSRTLANFAKGSKNDSSKDVEVKQLTIRGFDDELALRIRRLANREGLSLNQAVLKLLRRGAGIGQGKGVADTVGSSLDHLIGTWTPEEADEMDKALQSRASIDEAMWQ